MILVKSAYTEGFYHLNVSELAETSVDDVEGDDIFVLTEMHLRKLHVILNGLFDASESNRIVKKNTFY